MGGGDDAKAKSSVLCRPLLRHHPAASDVDARGFQRSVRLLRGADDGEVHAGLEVALVADHVVDDRHAGRNDDLLFAVAALAGDRVAVDGGHGLTDRAVGHGAVRYRRVGPMPFPGAAPGVAIGRAHVWTPVTVQYRMPASACEKD